MRAKKRDLLDRHGVMDALGITRQQFVKLTRSPIFPKPTVQTRDSIAWDADDIRVIARRFRDCAVRGWKVPDALYAWEFDAPKPWHLRMRDLRKKVHASRSANRRR